MFELSRAKLQMSTARAKLQMSNKLAFECPHTKLIYALFDKHCQCTAQN